MRNINTQAQKIVRATDRPRRRKSNPHRFAVVKNRRADCRFANQLRRARRVFRVRRAAINRQRENPRSALAQDRAKRRRNALIFGFAADDGDGLRADFRASQLRHSQQRGGVASARDGVDSETRKRPRRLLADGDDDIRRGGFAREKRGDGVGADDNPNPRRRRLRARGGDNRCGGGLDCGERQNPRRDSARPQSRGERAVFAARTSQQNGARIDPRREPRAQLRREPRADDLRVLFAFDLRFDEAAARRRVKSENPRALVFESNARAQRGVAIRVHRGGQGAPDRRPPRGLRLVERARGGDDIGAVGGAFDREQPLPDGGRESLRIENLANVAAAPEPMQPGRGEQQSVAIAAPHFGDSAGDIAAHQNGAQPRITRGEQGAAARAGGADGRAGRQIRERQIAIRNHGVARIGGGQKSGERKTRRQNGADIFERMDGAIGAPGVDLGFEFFDEKIFAADIGERAIDDFVAAAFYADNFNPATRMRASPFGGDNIRLAAREFALARNNNNRFHRPAQSQPAATAIATRRRARERL